MATAATERGPVAQSALEYFEGSFDHGQMRLVRTGGGWQIANALWGPA